MSHLIYNIETTRVYEACKPGRTYGTRTYASEGAAKAALTRLVNKGKITREEFSVAETGFYKDNIEKMITKTFIAPGTGKECTVTQSVNTPLCCDPSSETYWSM